MNIEGVHFDDITLIIRSSQERTEKLCKKLIIDQGIPNSQVFMVQEVPFSIAMEKSFQIGIRENRKWTLCIDADVLLRPGSIGQMLKLAEKQPSFVCEIQGFMIDKFFGGPRQAGNHMYRTSLLHKVIECIPPEGQDIRPETYALRMMAERGHPLRTVPYILGLHDSQQYNYDIYRKSFVQAVKHLARAELFITLWRNNLYNDHDFKVALRGFSDSICNTEPIFINSELKIFKKFFKQTGIREKEKLDPDEYTLETIEDIIINWNYPDIYYSFFPDKNGIDSQISGYWRKIQKIFQKEGLIKSVRKAAGELFLLMGRKIK